jgi:5'-nucleotidase
LSISIRRSSSGRSCWGSELPRILLTNDDGITSPGLHALHQELRRLGDVLVVAPDAERSAVGHAITTLTPLRVKEFRRGRQLLGYAANGTPADCVKLAIGSIFKDDPPDLVVSGINLGANTATNIIYSGTVSAATEARILGVPSIAVSLGTYLDPRWGYAAAFARRVALSVLKHGLPPKVLLNVNVPNLPRSEIKGVKVTRQGDSAYLDDLQMREDPRQQPYFWLGGSYQVDDEDPETDARALENGYVSITPVSFDLTAHHALAELASWGWKP